MIILFQNILLLKEFLACNGCFRLFTKIKREPGISFWCTFYAWFFHKNVFFNTLSTEKVSMSYLFSFPRYQTKCVIKFLFSQLMMSQTIRFMLDQPVKQWLTGRKEGKTDIQKLEYLENEKSFLDEMKNIFHSFWRAIIWLKIK